MSCIIQWELNHGPPWSFTHICPQEYRPKFSGHVLTKKMRRSDESSLNIPITLLRGENNSGTDSLAGMSCITQWELNHAPPWSFTRICPQEYRPKFSGHVLTKKIGRSDDTVCDQKVVKARKQMPKTHKPVVVFMNYGGLREYSIPLILQHMSDTNFPAELKAIVQWLQQSEQCNWTAEQRTEWSPAM
jgi:hypothetical protein